MVETLEKMSKTGMCNNTACNKDYDLSKRAQETSEIPLPNTAPKYCSDRCWIEGTSLDETLMEYALVEDI